MKELKGFCKGINLGGWLSQCDHTTETYEGFIKEEDFKKIAGWGLDHVRVPIDYDLVEDKDGNEIEDGYKYIDRAIAWSRANGLNMILDLHKTYGYSFDAGEKEDGFFDNEAFQERFYKLWEKLAGRYGKEQDMLILELLNEVTEKTYSDAWNRIATECIHRIRAVDATIPIIIGGYYNNSIEALPDLCRPDDDHLIYTFHCYEPLIFTHQGAYWAPGMDVNFRMSIDEPYRVMAENSKKHLTQVTVGFDRYDPEAKLDEIYFYDLFEEAVRIAEERDVPLYCGEYGVINLAKAEDTVKWYQYIHAAFEKYGIGRAAWTYREKDYGFVDEHMKPVLDEVVSLL